MILHFPDFETAALHAAKYRSEGYYAEPLDGQSSHLWGPAITGGARVLVSDEPVETEVMPNLRQSRIFMPILRVLTMAAILGGAFAWLATLIHAANLNRASPSNTRDLVELVLLAICLALSAPFSLLMIHLTREARMRAVGEPLRGWMHFVAILMIVFRFIL